MTRLWFRQTRERSYHGLRRYRDTKYLCGKIANKLTITAQDRFAISGQLCAKCLETERAGSL